MKMFLSKKCIFLPEMRVLGQEYFHTFILSDNCTSYSCKQVCPNFTQRAALMQSESNQDET